MERDGLPTRGKGQYRLFKLPVNGDTPAFVETRSFEDVAVLHTFHLDDGTDPFSRWRLFPHHDMHGGSNPESYRPPSLRRGNLHEKNPVGRNFGQVASLEDSEIFLAPEIPQGLPAGQSRAFPIQSD